MFKIGQKVVCVDTTKARHIKQNEIYTISDVISCGCGAVHLVLFEFSFFDPSQICGSCKTPTKLTSFLPYRFRPIDYTFGEKLAEEIQEEINQEQLIESV